MKIVYERKHDDCSKCGWDKPYDGSCEHKPGILKFILHVAGCCESSREWLTPYAYVSWNHIEDDDDDNYGQAGEPTVKWTANVRGPEDSAEHRYRMGKTPHMPRRFYEEGISFCPFCGTKLPELVKAENPPSPIMDIDDCGHCACGWPRSCGQCECWPREALFEVKT